MAATRSAFRCWKLHVGCWLLLLFLTRSALAHDPGLSTATVRLGTNRLTAALVFSTTDTALIVDFDADADGQITADEQALGLGALTRLAAGALDVTSDTLACRATFARVEFDDKNNTTVHASFTIGSFTNLVIRPKWLAYFPPGHRQFMTVQDIGGATLAERLLSANSDTITILFDGAAPDAAPAAAATTHTASSFLDFLELGIKHILTGYDHLLFLLALLIVVGRWMSSLKIITCFTIAHSITLAVATFNVVQLPSRIVEPLIALSIVYVGVENLFRREDPAGRWLLTFAFGLVHGFGFASVLREMGVGARAGGVLMPLFSFNLGVELGQIMVAAIVLPFIWKFRTNPVFVRRWVPACSVLVALAGAFWFAQRVWGS